MTEQKAFKHSHTYLNYIFSIYQGIFIFENVLMRLKHPLSDKVRYSDVQHKMEKIIKYFQDLWQNHPFLLACEFPTEIDEMLNECIADIVSSVEMSVRLEELSESIPDCDLPVVLGIAAKSAYIRENFLNGIIAYCEYTNMTSDADYWREYIRDINNDTDRVGYYLGRFEDGLDDRLRHDIMALFKGYSHIFSNHLSEIEKWRFEYKADAQS